MLLSMGTAFAQKQLVILKREKVLLRLFPGDEFVYKLKGSKTVKTSYVNNLIPDAVIAHRDTVRFNEVDRIYFRQNTFYNTVGTVLTIFGAGLFLIDQVNVVVVNGESPSLDDNVTALSLSSLAVGLPMMLIKKKSRRIRYPVKMLIVEKGSGLYRPDLREQIGP